MEQKRVRKRKFSLMFVAYCLIFFAFAPTFGCCEYTLTFVLLIWLSSSPSFLLELRHRPLPTNMWVVANPFFFFRFRMVIFGGILAATDI